MTETLAIRAALSGTLGSLASTAALMALGQAEGHSPWRPTNATAHWLHGRAAAAAARPDLPHTGVGYATHHLATTFWALGYEAWLGPRRVTPAAAFGAALAVSAVAAAVDYGVTPKRFTPGWEYVLSPRAMAVAYAAMAFGLAAGAMVARRRR